MKATFNRNTFFKALMWHFSSHPPGCEDYCQAGCLGTWPDGGQWPELLLQLD